MMFYIMGLLLATVQAAMVVNNNDNCVTIRNAFYEQKVLKNNIKSPYQLTLDYDTNTLFFSYTARLDEMFKIAFLSLKTGQYDVVKGIHGGFASAVNKDSHTVYMGGEDGIYEFDYKTKSATNLHIKDDVNIWQMFYKTEYGLFFTTYPDEKAYLYKNNQVMEVAEVKDIKVMIIAATKENNNLVYSNSSGLFMYNKANVSVTRLGNFVVNGITADIDGNLYFSTSYGIYYLNETKNSVDELILLDSVYGVVIEGNGNIIYATEESIIRLTPTKTICLEETLAL